MVLGHHCLFQSWVLIAGSEINIFVLGKTVQKDRWAVLLHWLLYGTYFALLLLLNPLACKLIHFKLPFHHIQTMYRILEKEIVAQKYGISYQAITRPIEDKCGVYFSGLAALSQSLEVNSMYCQRERLATIDFFELPGSTVESIKLLHSFRNYLEWCLLPVYLLQPALSGVQGVDALDDLPGILLKEENKELMLAALQHVYQFLSFASIQLPRETHVGYCVYHELLVRLLRERVLAVFRLDAGLLLPCRTLVASSRRLTIKHISAAAFSLVSPCNFGGTVWTDRPKISLQPCFLFCIKRHVYFMVCFHSIMRLVIQHCLLAGNLFLRTLPVLLLLDVVCQRCLLFILLRCLVTMRTRVPHPWRVRLLLRLVPPKLLQPIHSLTLQFLYLQSLQLLHILFGVRFTHLHLEGTIASNFWRLHRLLLLHRQEQSLGFFSWIFSLVYMLRFLVFFVRHLLPIGFLLCF